MEVQETYPAKERVAHDQAIAAEEHSGGLSATQPSEGLATIPYHSSAKAKRGEPGEQPDSAASLALSTLLPVSNPVFRSLARKTAIARLLPPLFSDNTIPRKPDKDMWQVVEESKESYLLGDVFQDAVPATSAGQDLVQEEAAFLVELRQDIADGRLDMPFSSFIIRAEYYQLSRALLLKKLQPSFTLDEAFARYRDRLGRVRQGVPQEVDGFSVVMILQRYADNKFYPGNGSGMLLDSLFHNLNDCEGGTKEVLAYLNEIYPALILGSNRGMLQTTTGELIGHMQVFIGPGEASRKIIENDRGVILETTRVSRESVIPYVSGDVFPLEDFVVHYYPEIVAGTPLAARLGGQDDGGAGGQRKIVGTSDHPLKMSYGASATLLTEQFYDLANIRTRKIENEFLRSDIPSCDPRIDPTKIDRTNLFSNFVAIDGKLRKNLIDHYLADLDYWDNQLMPQWKTPPFLATYADLAGSLLGPSGEMDGYLQIDAENTISYKSLFSHQQFLASMRDRADNSRNRYVGSGLQDCQERAVLDKQLLAYLFEMPNGPGLYFLPAPADDFSWHFLQKSVVNDCLAVPAEGLERNHIAILEDEAVRQRTSLRKELYSRALTRGLSSSPQTSPLEKVTAAIEAVFTGVTGSLDLPAILADRQSAESTVEEPSIREMAGEVGRTGINNGLIWDAVDFLGVEKTRALILVYGARDDLSLSLWRANAFVQNLVAILASQESDRKATADFLARLGKESGRQALTVAAAIALAGLQGQDQAEISAIAVRYLEQLQPYRAEDLLALMRYGLRHEDAVSFIHRKIKATLAGLPSLTPGKAGPDAKIEIFPELVEVVRTLSALSDPAGQELLALGLMRSLDRDFTRQLPEGQGGYAGADYGLVFNKLAVLGLLPEPASRPFIDPAELEALLKNYIRFAANQPVGKLMVALVEKAFSREKYAKALAGIIRTQLTELAGLRSGLEMQSMNSSEDIRSPKTAGVLSAAKIILGDANVLVQILLQADSQLASLVAGHFPGQFSGAKTFPAAWYLSGVHRQMSEAFAARLPGGTFIADFYLDDRVRESFAMLAYVQENKADASQLRFRIIKDIRTIKDPSKVKVIEAERKITRQDMSLLTLALNTGNSPAAIRQAWEDTLAVAGGHLGLNPLGESLRQYLFAPHSPYLVEDDLGFFFSPETVEDFHNADQWGGRNDILLSSYLHFRNLPEYLPDWLLRAAMTRSQFEQQILKKFENLSFLPMILECANDHETLPEGLFRAQWTIRKPFGEDIFPGTLLLLRLGYMEISPVGEVVLTAKYGAR